MIKDVRYNQTRNDLEFEAGQLPRAENLITVQTGDIDYAPTWGVDLAYFLNPDYKIQAESFEAYLLQRIGFWGMNVLELIAKQGKFVRNMLFNFAEQSNNNSMLG